MKKLIVMFLLLRSICINAQWIQTNGPGGGTFFCLAVLDKYIYAGSEEGGIYRSSNDGDKWMPMNNGLNNTNVWDIVVLDNKIFIANDEGIFVSTNFGMSWNRTGLIESYMKNLAVYDNSLYASTMYNQIFRSTDLGNTWSEISPGQIAQNVNISLITDMKVEGENIYVTTNGTGLVYSTDNGRHWFQASLQEKELSSITISGKKIYACSNMRGGVFLSEDEGKNWTKLSDLEANALLVSDQNIFLCTSHGIYKSIDNGKSWFSLNEEMKNAEILSIVNTGSEIFIGTMWKGIYRSTDNGIRWTQMGNGLTASVVSGLTFSHDKLYAGTVNSGAFVSKDNGNSWNKIADIDSHLSSGNAFKIIGSSLFIGNLNGLFRSTDNGKNWTNVLSQACQAIEICDSTIFVGTYGGIFISTNDGLTWRRAGGTGFIRPAYTISFVVDGYKIFAGTSDGVYLSTDNGKKWKQTYSGISGQLILSLAVSGKYLYAATESSGLFRSSDDGNSWEQISKANNVRIVVTLDNNIFIGTRNDGVYTSSDYGDSWIEINNGLTSKCIYSLLIKGRYLYAGTFGSGVCKILLPQAIREISSQNILLENYPNPFNSSTTIEFSIPKTAHVTLKIFNVMGQEIEQLFSQEMKAGYYVKQWIPVNCSSGVYFYRLQSGSFSQTKKFILIK